MLLSNLEVWFGRVGFFSVDRDLNHGCDWLICLIERKDPRDDPSISCTERPSSGEPSIHYSISFSTLAFLLFFAFTFPARHICTVTPKLWMIPTTYMVLGFVEVLRPEGRPHSEGISRQQVHRLMPHGIYIYKYIYLINTYFVLLHVGFVLFLIFFLGCCVFSILTDCRAE